MKYVKKLALIGLLLTGSTVQAGSAAAAGVGGGLFGLFAGSKLLCNCPKDSEQVTDLREENKRLKADLKEARRKRRK